MQYMSQSFRIKNPKIKDLFMDIAAKERSHMEMAAQAINLLNGHGVKADKVQVGEIETHVLLGLNPGLINASGYSWTADYVTVTGDLCADLPSNIASEQRAKVVYEYLYRQIEDKKVRETVDFLLNREEAYNQMFRDTFNEVQDSGSNRDFGTTKAAKMYFSLQPRPQRLRGKRSDRTQVCKIMKSPLMKAPEARTSMGTFHISAVGRSFKPFCASSLSSLTDCRCFRLPACTRYKNDMYHHHSERRLGAAFYLLLFLPSQSGKSQTRCRKAPYTLSNSRLHNGS